MPILVLLAACDPTPTAANAGDFVGLRVEPADATLTTGVEGGDTVAFRAVADYEQGEGAEVPLVEWSLSNETVGTIDAEGTFTAAGGAGGVTLVVARVAGLEASATLTVVFQDVLVEEGAAPDAFEEGAEPGEDRWRYPEDGVNIPRNTSSIRFEWDGDGADAFQLRFRSALTDLTVYTDSDHWTASDELWPAIASTNAGGSVSVDLAWVEDGRVLASPTRTIQVNRLDARGSIVYWSSSQSGLVEIPYGGEAVPFLTLEQTGMCVGCHAIARDGTVALTYATEGGEGSQMGWMPYGSWVPPSAWPDPPPRGIFKTFSPDGSLLLAAEGGFLRLYDVASGAELGTWDFGAPLTQPDWSPAGDQVVAVRPATFANDNSFTGGALVLLPVGPDGVPGAPEPLLEPGPGENLYYPAFSPDGAWIAFNRSTGDGYDDPDAALEIVAASGGEPIPLVRANGGTGLTNSWPRWGPLPDDVVLWLTFSSRRAYGTVVEGEPQIWVAAVDPALAAKGMDPSWPAFWLPDQAPEENNHLPIWAP